MKDYDAMIESIDEYIATLSRLLDKHPNDAGLEEQITQAGITRSMLVHEREQFKALQEESLRYDRAMTASEMETEDRTNSEMETVDRTTALVPSAEDYPRVLRQANQILDIIELLVPKRIADEELGDAMESMGALIKRGRPVWQIRVKLVSTVFWVIVHTFHHIIKGPAKTPKKEG